MEEVAASDQGGTGGDPRHCESSEDVPTDYTLYEPGYPRHFCKEVGFSSEELEHLPFALGKDAGTVHEFQSAVFPAPGTSVHFIDVRPHPKGAAWFDRGLFDIIYDNWPHLLIYRPDIRSTLPVPDEGVHELLKEAVSFIPFREGSLFPTNMGVVASGDSALAARTAGKIFNRLTAWQLELSARKDEIRKLIRRKGMKPPAELDYELIVESGFFMAYELQTHAKIRMFPVP